MLARIPDRYQNFNPPSPCGEGPAHFLVGAIGKDISIHPPRVGRDVVFIAQLHHGGNISIHPPRVGRDPNRAVAGDHPGQLDVEGRKG